MKNAYFTTLAFTAFALNIHCDKQTGNKDCVDCLVPPAQDASANNGPDNIDTRAADTGTIDARASGTDMSDVSFADIITTDTETNVVKTNIDECAAIEQIPLALLGFPGKIYPMKTWTWSDGSSSISGTVGDDWPTDAPVYGHYAFLSSDRSGYSFMSSSDTYLDLETGIFHATTWNGSGILTAETLGPPEAGSDTTKYLKKAHAALINDHAMISWQNPRCVAYANSAYLSRFLTDAADRYEFTDQYLIPPERLYFGGYLHYTSLVYVEGNGYSAGLMFSAGPGAANSIINNKPAASGHYGLTLKTRANSLELDLETGELFDFPTFYAPTDAGYIDELKKMRTVLVKDMIDRPIDDGEPWYFNSAIFKDARDYLQYVIDRQAAPKP